MAGATKLMTAGGGGVSLTPASSIASDVTVNVPVTGVSGGTLVCSDSSGNVGIGTSSPSGNLHIASATDPRIIIQDTNEATFTLIAGGSAQLESSAAMVFRTVGSERMRIDSSGNLLVGTTTAYGAFAVNQPTSNADAVVARSNSASPGGSILFNAKFDSATPNNSTARLYWGGDATAARFIVYSNGGISNYQANNSNLSDSNEKTDFAPAKPYLDVICSIPVQTFKYIDQTDDEFTLGVVAQDVQVVAPELVTESNWGTEEEPRMRLSIYQTDLQYALMKAIQELNAKVEAQAAEIAALKGAA